MFKKTVQNSFAVKGYGIHNGRESMIVVKPNKSLNGIYFIVTGEMGPTIIPADMGALVSQGNRTVLKAGHYIVNTPEHLLSPMYALGIGSAQIDLYGYEVPILRGNSNRYFKELCKAKLVETTHKYRDIQIDREINIALGAAGHAIIRPDKNLIVNVHLEYENPEPIGNQMFSYFNRRAAYAEDIVWARTYASEEEIKEMQNNEMALASTPNNTIIYSDKTGKLHEDSRVIEKTEFARHKILDFLGDLTLLGARVYGHFKLTRPGHRLNHAIIRELAKAYL